MKKVILSILSVAILVIAYWLISPLFIKVELNEVSPEKVVTSQIKTSEVKTIVKEDGMQKAKEEMIQVETKVVIKTESKSLAGSFVNGAHDVSGSAKIINVDGKSTLRLENFSSENGPDLYMYLATDNSARDFVNLGKLKATQGNVNYDIPTNIDVTKYNHALIWCKAFGVLFGSAELR